MPETSERKANAILFAGALGLAALYGGLTAFVLWLGSWTSIEEAVQIGGIVAGATAGLALFVVVFFVWILGPEDKPFARPMNGFHRLLLVLACLAFIVLAIPPTVVTLGLFWRWLNGGPKEKEAFPEARR